MAENGKLPASDLERTVVGVTVRKDLAKQTNQMALAFYRDLGKPMKATDGYRSYEQQVDVKRRKGKWAATPGKSNHGWATAVDWASNINVDGSAEHKWMEKNGPRFGWVNPEWAEDYDPSNGQHEPWHWEAKPKKVNAPYVGMPAKGEIGFGSSGAKVKEVQELLKKYGFKNLKVDSDFGMTTGDAVVRFQEDKGLVQDGIVGAKTLAALKGGKVAKPLPAPKPSKPKGPLDVDGVWGEATTRQLQKVLRVRVQDGVLSGQHRYYGFREIYGKGGWQFVDRTGRGSTTVEALQEAIGAGLNDGLFGPQTMTQLARRYRTSGYKNTIKALQERLNEGRI